MKHLLLSTIIALTAVIGASALPASVYPAHSRLASGRWVRVTTDREGIYQLTHEQLRGLGFDDPARVHVWGADAFELSEHAFTASTADPLYQTPSVHTADGRLLFYGRAPYTVSVPSTELTSAGFSYSRDSYSLTASYLLTDAAGDDLAIEPRTSALGSMTTLDTHIHIDLFEEELQRPVQGGVLAMGKSYQAGDVAEFPFSVRHWSTGGDSPAAMFSHMMVAAATSTSRMEARAPEGTTRLKATAPSAFAVTFPTAYAENTGTLWFEPSDGRTDRDLTVTVPISSSIAYSYVAADYGILAYHRDNILDATDPALVMVLGEKDAVRGRALSIAGAPASTRLWAIDRLRQCVELSGETDADGASVSFTLPRAVTRLVAFDQSAVFPSPAIVGDIPCRDLRGEPVPDMLIVTTDAMMPGATQLADIHRRLQGLDVLVVTQKELDAEFSAGSPHAMNARLMAKMLYDRDPAKFKYVLMYGPSTGDPRRIDTPLDFETLVCYENDDRRDCADHVRSFVSDKYFGMLADDYRHSLMASRPMQVAVGRISARTIASARDFNTKAELWLTDPASPAVSSAAVLISGNQNKNAHVEHALRAQEVMAAEDPAMTFTQVPTKVFRPDRNGILSTHRRVMSDALRRGAGFIGYTGHGSVNFIQDASLLSTGIVASTPYAPPPLAVLASCAQFTYDHLGSSLLETMVLTPRGGAIAGVAACRSVYLRYNLYTYETMAAAYAAAGPGATVGSVYLDARRRLLEQIPVVGAYQPDELINDMCYNLAGDPALPIYKPSRTIAIDAPAQITPLRAATVTGSILGADGSVDTSFDGPVTLTLYDGARSVSTLNDCGEADFTPLTFDLSGDVLGVASGTARAGRFSLVLTVPEPGYAAPTYTAIASATRADDAASGAIGRAELSVAPDADDSTPASAPVIRSLYADTPDYIPGDAVGGTFTLYADIDPGTAGLNFSTGGISTHSRVMIDGNVSYTGIGGYFSRLDDGTMRLAMPMTDLSDGYHAVELTVADNAGATDRATIDIYVLSHGSTADCAVALDTPTADTAVTISLDGTADAERLLVTDATGRTVYTAATPRLPLRWDLRATDGTALPDGRYTVRLLLRQGSDYGAATPAPLVILR